MAVRHGYGKIAGADALVFAYDTGDTRNSYKGEPTTNLQPTGGAGVHDSNSGNVVTVTDATAEKGAGWKKVTITARGSNFRTLQFTYTSMSANVTYTHSAVFDWGNMRDKGYFVNHDGNGTGQRFFYLPGDYDTNVGGSVTINSALPDGKLAGKIVHTATHNHALFINNYTLNQSGLNDYFYYKDYQVEANTHPTQYTAGTRSATQGLLDLTGNYTLDISNASFDSNAFITFDGSSDYIDILNSTALFSGTQDFTVEAAYSLEGQGGGEIFGNYGSGHTTDHLWFSGMYGLWINGGVYAPGYPLANGRYHMVGTRKNGLVELYLNGELVNSGTRNASIATDINYRIGADVNGAAEPFTGDIFVVKAYNRALTAAEVKNNFNNYKGRFNL